MNTLMVNELIDMFSEKKITAKELAKLYDLKESQIRRIVNTLRCNGIPICSNHKGYNLSKDIMDIQSTINSLKSRVKQMQKAIVGLESALEVLMDE